MKERYAAEAGMASIRPPPPPLTVEGEAFQFEHQPADPAHKGSRVLFRGRLTFGEATPLWDGLRALKRRLGKRERVDLDLGEVSFLDGGAMALLANFRCELYRRGGRAEFVNGSDDVTEIVKLYRGDQPVGRPKKRKAPSTLTQIGTATLEMAREGQVILGFLGQLLVSLGGIVREPKSGNFRELPPLMERTGADAVPIVLLINFLVGLVMAFQSAVQLKRFGANILVADLIGISITRELGPLMTAIVVCGRSGAAFAAELGSMKVNEEVDALRTMGLGPMRFLVLPRLLALMLVMPLLTLLADVMGIVGGLIVALTSLDLTATAYFNEIEKAVRAWDVVSGLIKSVLFGGAIALIACQQGLATEGGAEGVGRRTTAAVVTTLFTLILIDAAFTIFFRVLGK
ncbi:MAG: MlaE family lipid ABC transporter permease subunit [Polyangiales bacterium]